MYCLIASSSSIINTLKTNIYLEDAAVDIYTAEISAMGIILLEPESAINLTTLTLGWDRVSRNYEGRSKQTFGIVGELVGKFT